MFCCRKEAVFETHVVLNPGSRSSLSCESDFNLDLVLTSKQFSVLKLLFTLGNLFN